MIVGSVFGLFIAGYTGVLLAVSNQPVWSDTWTLGGLFLASGLSSAAAVLMLLSRYRRGAEASADVPAHLGASLHAARGRDDRAVRGLADRAPARWSAPSGSRGSCCGWSPSPVSSPGSSACSRSGSPSPATATARWVDGHRLAAAHGDVASDAAHAQATASRSPVFVLVGVMALARRDHLPGPPLVSPATASPPSTRSPRPWRPSTIPRSTGRSPSSAWSTPSRSRRTARSASASC